MPVTTWTAGQVLAAQDLNDTFASKANYPSGGSNGDMLTKSGTTTAWAAPSVAALTLITRQTFSAVSSVSLNGCFSATYTNYRLVLRLTASEGNDMRARLRVSGSDNTTASSYVSNYINGTGATIGGSTDTDSFWNFAIGNATAPYSSVHDLTGPNLTANTTFLSHAARSDRVTIRGGYHNQATAYDGITIYPSGGTITGTVWVYGYKD